MRLALLIPLFLGCGGAPPSGHTEVPAASFVAAEGSLYDLDWTMEGPRGPVRLDAWRGHPTLISMFYTSCPMACPMLIERIRGVQGALPEAARADLRVMMVSLDPSHDTPEVLARTYEERALDPGTWALARVEEERVRELAAVLGIPYRRAADGGFNHASVLVLLDADGKMVRRVDGADQPVDALLADVERLTRR